MKRNNMHIPGIDMDATGKRISLLIDDSGMTDKELGEIMDLSVQSINKWRHGHNLPDIENLFILSRILGVKVDDILVPQREVQYEAEAKAECFSAAGLRHLLDYFARLRDKMLNHGIITREVAAVLATRS